MTISRIKIRILKIGGAFWLKSLPRNVPPWRGYYWGELFLTKTQTVNSEIQSLGRAKRKGLGGSRARGRSAFGGEFLPALAFAASFFAAAEFRANEVGAPP